VPQLPPVPKVGRGTLAAAFDRVGGPGAVLSLRRLRRAVVTGRPGATWVTVLTYHRVARRGDAPMLDQGVIDVAPDQLDRQLAFLRRWFAPIGVEELRAYVAGAGPLPHNPVLVTFDDGYRDNHDVALPILLRHGVRATFFVATDYVERRRPYWWDRINFVVNASARGRLVLDYPERLELPIDGAGERRETIRRALRIVKDRRGLDLPRFLDGLETAAGVTVSRDEERRLADETVMTWEHVRALRRAGMDVQSHTHTHRVLQTLEAREVEAELRTSRAVLEEALGEPVRAVSYPVGRPLGAAPEVRRAVRDAGYELGFSNGTGVNRARTLDPLDVKRVSLDADIEDALFRAMLALPRLAH